MENSILYVLYLHILAGSFALVTGFIAILSAKGKSIHKKAGSLYFYAMSMVFITGIVVASYRFNKFLLLIAFLSYYSVFAGIRILKLKNLHKQQKPILLDWVAGIVNAIANIIFIGLGLYYGFSKGFTSAGTILSIGFGIGGLLISYTNLKPFIIKPKKAYHWYLSHIGNMMGGYIATFTAFLSTLVTRFELINPFLAFALPSLIGIPFLMYWQKQTEKQLTSK